MNPIIEGVGKKKGGGVSRPPAVAVKVNVYIPKRKEGCGKKPSDIGTLSMNSKPTGCMCKLSNKKGTEQLGDGK